MALMGLLPRMGLLQLVSLMMKAFLWASDFPGSLSVSYVCLSAGTNGRCCVCVCVCVCVCARARVCTATDIIMLQNMLIRVLYYRSIL
jgi:hypothetical protein